VEHSAAPPAGLRLFQYVPAAALNQVPAKGLAQAMPEPLYVLEAEESSTYGCLVLSLAQQKMTATDRLGKLRKLTLSLAETPRIASAADRTICLMLMGAGMPDSGYGYYGGYAHSSKAGQSRWTIPPEPLALPAQVRLAVHARINSDPSVNRAGST
jgi:hypothetical protein